jgi:hypothetical protein
MKKLTIWIALVGLVCFVGCTHGLVFVKNNNGLLYRVEDNNSGLAQINVPPPGQYYYRPDVSHDAQYIAFVSSTASGTYSGDIYRANLDGTNTKLVIAGPKKTFPKWSNQFVAYYDGATKKIDKVDALSGGMSLPVNIQDCSTSPLPSPPPCDGGLDLYADGSKLVFSWLQSGHYILYVTETSASGTTTLIQSYQPTDATYIDETLPVVSYSADQMMLASAYKTNINEGIRMRAMDSAGNWGPPFTAIPSPAVTNISGVSFSYENDKVYFSAQSSGVNTLYYIGLAELMSGMGISPPVVRTITPTKISAGSGENYMPSGINK